AFATGDDQVVNFKFYYYLVVPYTRNESGTPLIQYRPSRRLPAVIKAVPHKVDPEFGGVNQRSDYGNGPSLFRQEGTGNGGNILDLTEATEQQILSQTTVLNPAYEQGAGPVNIRVIDPTRIVPGDYEFRFVDVDTVMPANPNNFTNLKPEVWWRLTNLTTGEVVQSDTTLGAINEQVILKWGFAVTVQQPYGPGFPEQDLTNGFLLAEVEYENSGQRWLGGVPDVDPNNSLNYAPNNWIRSGKQGRRDAPISEYNDNVGIWDAATLMSGVLTWVDPLERYEGLLNGTVAPAAVAARSGKTQSGFFTFGPIPEPIGGKKYDSVDLVNLASVDIVFTSDKSKWSRCIVLEMGEEPSLNEGNAPKFNLRRHAGWDKQVGTDGKPVYSTDPNMAGVSYFPGYAINLETGQRLNIFFGEDSRLTSDNGNDMIWNPTSTFSTPSYSFGEFTGYIVGGKHWIYVANSQSYVKKPSSWPALSVPYDGCETYRQFLSQSSPNPYHVNYLWSHVMWVAEPMLAFGNSFTSLADGLIPNETRIRLRVAKPYATYNTKGTSDNKHMPSYTFNSEDIALAKGPDLGKKAMELINIVPNPYYAYSSYETSQLDNRVRITNLPQKCDISIFTLNGTLVRKFKKDETDENHQTYLDWDLKNNAGVPIASGVYIIHVDGHELGSKTLKWFGVMRPIDLDTF
ncbi:MAG: hypothetical protein M3Q97_05405, partial [Bacteroidota bacterium]|nr:hypothetical protein [Bacteroidota bacterium]